MRRPLVWALRRLVVAPAVVALTALMWLTLPGWLLVAAALAPLLPGRWRALRVLWLVLLYATFEKAAHSPIGLIILIGLTWSFFQHLLSGIRHLVTDTGAAFELGVNKTSAILTIVVSVLFTAALWLWILGYLK